MVISKPRLGYLPYEPCVFCKLFTLNLEGRYLPFPLNSLSRWRQRFLLFKNNCHKYCKWKILQLFYIIRALLFLYFPWLRPSTKYSNLISFLSSFYKKKRQRKSLKWSQDVYCRHFTRIIIMNRVSYNVNYHRLIYTWQIVTDHE